MQVSLENIGGLERRMTVQLNEEEFSADITNRLNEVSRTTRVPGFRPGKVPMKVIENRFGKQVRQEVVGQKVQTSYQEAILQEKIKPAGFPSIDLDESKIDGISYSATFEVMPEIEITGLDSMTVEKPTTEIKDSDIDEMVERLRKQRAEWQTAAKAAADGDSIIIDFKGKIDGEVFKGGEAEDFEMELGAKRMIEGFEDGLIGSKAGDEKDLPLKFPDDYHAEDLAGKDVVFEIKVKEVKESQLPELNDEFFKQFGVEEGGVEAFREELKQNMAKELDKNISNIVRENVMDELFKSHEIELPKVMVDGEAQRLQEEFLNNLKQQGLPKEALAKTDPSIFEDQARKRVSLQLLLGEIIQINELKADPKKVRQLIEQEAQNYGDPSSIINWYYQDAERLREVEAVVLEREVIDWVLSQCKSQDKEMSFDEIMNKRQTGNA